MPVAALVAAPHVDASKRDVDESLRTQPDAAIRARCNRTHFDHRCAWRVLRAVGNEQIEQQHAGIDQMRADPQQRVERRGRIGQELERSPRDKRRGVAKRQIERGHVLAEKLGRGAARLESRAAACKHRLGDIDAVDAKTRLEQRNQQPSGAGHDVEDRSGRARQPGRVPCDLAITRSSLFRVVEERPEGSVGRYGLSFPRHQ